MPPPSGTAPVVFLLDVDNTLLDHDAAQEEYHIRIAQECGKDSARRYWEIFEELRGELGYSDYLGALQRYRLENRHSHRLFLVSSFLLDYPFANRVYPGARELVEELGRAGTTVLLTDGDVVFQPRKIERAGLARAVDDRVLVTLHKEDELDEVERLYPARHYVMVDDKIRILTAIKRFWGRKVTTVFVRQGHYALDQETVGKYAPADITLERIADLRSWDIEALVKAGE